MTDTQAKAAGVKLVREWATESGDFICDTCGGMGHIFTPSPEGPYFQKSEICIACLGTGTDQRFLQ